MQSQSHLIQRVMDGGTQLQMHILEEWALCQMEHADNISLC